MIRRLVLAAAMLHGSVASADFFWSGTFERSLSAYEIFEDAAVQRPAAGFVPYDVIAPLFSDYSDKDRFVYLPPGSSMQYDSELAFEFPTGAAIVKTFSYPVDKRIPESGRRLIETRLMVNTEDGWTGAAYLWNEQQTDATLKIAGAEVPVDWIDENGYCRSIKYLVPDMNQCKNCHRDTTGEMHPIGIKARHLNRSYAYADGTENQLAHWNRQGLLGGLHEASSIPALPDPEDERETLASRAMAYLEINCAHCHNPNGLAGHTGLDLRWIQDDPSSRGVMKRPTTAGNAARDRYFAIVPGYPDQSFLLHRVLSERPDVRMPPVGRTIAHVEGAELIADWIKSLR